MNSARMTGLVAFIATLIAVVLLSKIGGSGADLAIMTGLIGVLGMLAPGLVPSRGNEAPKQATPSAAGGAQAAADAAQDVAEDLKP